MTFLELIAIGAVWVYSNFLSYEYGKTTQGATTQYVLNKIGTSHKEQEILLTNYRLSAENLTEHLNEQSQRVAININTKEDPCSSGPPTNSLVIMDAWRSITKEPIGLLSERRANARD